MDIEMRHITVAELVEGYRDDGEGGVVGYDGNLDIRPRFQPGVRLQGQTAGPL